jgi:hypothetical protein
MSRTLPLLAVACGVAHGSAQYQLVQVVRILGEVAVADLGKTLTARGSSALAFLDTRDEVGMFAG